MLSCTFTNSHSQVSDPGPEDPLVSKLFFFQKHVNSVIWFVSRSGRTFCLS